MDFRNASLILVAALAGASTAQASSLSVDLGGNATNHNAVSQFVGFVVSDSNVAIHVSTSGNIESQNTAVIAAGNFEFDGSEISAQLNPGSQSFGGTVARAFHSAPDFALVLDSGNGTIQNVPLPAPLAMGGIGLLSLGGVVGLKRRARG